MARGFFVSAEDRNPSREEIFRKTIALKENSVDFVVALESALCIHEFAYNGNRALWIAVARGTRIPSVGFPVRDIQPDSAMYMRGVETREFNGVKVQVYSAARTVTYLVKHRDLVGLTRARNAIKECLYWNKCNEQELLHYARLNRVHDIVKQYVRELN